MQLSVPDLCNGFFESVGGALQIFSVISIRKAKRIEGVHWAPTLLFSSWGLWNLYFYPHLHQWASFIGGLLMVIVNLTWLGHVGYYKWVQWKTK